MKASVRNAARSSESARPRQPKEPQPRAEAPREREGQGDSADNASALNGYSEAELFAVEKKQRMMLKDRLTKLEAASTLLTRAEAAVEMLRGQV